MENIVELLKSEYGVTIKKKNKYNPLSGVMCKEYLMYSADGSYWDTCYTLKDCLKECKQFSDVLLNRLREISES